MLRRTFQTFPRVSLSSSSARSSRRYLTAAENKAFLEGANPPHPNSPAGRVENMVRAGVNAANSASDVKSGVQSVQDLVGASAKMNSMMWGGVVGVALVSWYVGTQWREWRGQAEHSKEAAKAHARHAEGDLRDAARNLDHSARSKVQEAEDALRVKARQASEGVERAIEAHKPAKP